MKKTIKHTFLILLAGVCAVALLNSCKKENLCDCFKTTGNEITITRDIAFFDTLYVTNKMDVYLVQDSIFKIEITGGKHVVGLIKTDVRNGRLTISNNNKCNFVRSYKRKIKVYVHAPNFRWIQHNGVGNVYCDNVLTTDTITYQIFNSGDIHLNVNNHFLHGGVNGMGDIYVTGKTYEHLSNINGEGFLNAEELQTNISDLYLKTSGLSYFYATDRITVIITQSGDAYYKGNPPVIQKTITGTGKLIPI